MNKKSILIFMTVYSHSRLSCFEQCPYKFKLNYIDKVKTEVEESVEAFLGVRVHVTLEKLYRDLQFQKKNSLVDLISFFNNEWQKIGYPVWLTEVPERIMIRFDTNGIVFGNEKYSNLFYNEIYNLYQCDKLKNINIQIDYSFKGNTLKEYYWSQKKQLPTKSVNNDKTVELDKHPQVKGYNNIINNINRLTKEDKNFKNCVSITVEKGIDHDYKNKVWMYNKEAFNWSDIASKLGLEFSDVVNKFDLNYHWNFNAKVYRYTRRGALIEFIDKEEKIDTNNSSIPEMLSFINQHKKNEEFAALIYPVDFSITIKKQTKIKTYKKTKIPLDDQNYWIITGSEQNLRYGIKNGIWGVGKKYEELWNKLRKNDLIFFYCTRSISGIVGYGNFSDKYIDDKPFWPNEKKDSESRYPLRIKFATKKEVKDWNKSKKTLYGSGITYYYGINYVEPSKKQKLIEIID